MSLSDVEVTVSVPSPSANSKVVLTSSLFSNESSPLPPITLTPSGFEEVASSTIIVSSPTPPSARTPFSFI